MKTKTFFKDIQGNSFFLKKLTTEQEMRDNPKVIALLNRLATESEIDLQKRIIEQEITLKTLHKPEELWQVSEQWLKTSFETPANRIVFVIEDEKGEPAHCTILTVNDPEARYKNKVPEDVGTYVYLTHAVTEEKYKGCGLFSKLFDKINTMYLNPKRDLPLPIHYAISVSNAPAIRISDGMELNFIMNLPAYTGMWQRRLTDNKIQLRFQDLETGAQEGRERLPVRYFLDGKGKLEEDKISDLVESKKPEAGSEGKFVRGMFEEGKEARSYAEAVKFRRINNPKQLAK